VAVNERLMGEIARQRRLADAIRADEYGIGSVLEEVERHQRLEGGAITAFWPCPIEVANGFEAADMGVLETALQASARTLLLFPVEHLFDPATRFGKIWLEPTGHAGAELWHARAVPQDSSWP
jgi:hypothetical protein